MLHAPLVGRALPADKREVPERILLVDDHPLTRDALAALLAQQGFEVVGDASSGEEAIVEAERLQPDIVLLDLTMPGMDGLTALPGIREEAPNSEVVVLTASDAEENLLAAIRAGRGGLPPEDRASGADRDLPARRRARRGGALRRRRAAAARPRPRGRPARRDPRGDHAPALRARGRGAPAPRRAPRDGRDRAAPLHLGAHGPLAREEPAAQARRLVAGARRSSASRRRAASSRGEALERGLDEVGQRVEVVPALEHGGRAGASAAQRRARSRMPVP